MQAVVDELLDEELDAMDALAGAAGGEAALCSAVGVRLQGWKVVADEVRLSAGRGGGRTGERRRGAGRRSPCPASSSRRCCRARDRELETRCTEGNR